MRYARISTILKLVLYLSLYFKSISSFSFCHSYTRRKGRGLWKLSPTSLPFKTIVPLQPCYFTTKGADEDNNSVRTSTYTKALPTLPSSSPQYEELMDRLSEDDKYNILLQGRCSTIIDAFGSSIPSKANKSDQASNLSTEAEFGALYKLVEEMTSKNVQLTSKSFAALIDAASLSKNLEVMQSCLILARKNGICRAFSRSLGDLDLPSSVEIERQLDGLVPLPEDQRSVELGLGLAAFFLLGGSFLLESIGGPFFHMDTTPATIIIFVFFIAAFFDFTQRQSEQLKLILSGLNRLFLRDPEREARVQAASFLSAYLLGLPCFCFAPNVLEAVRMSTEVPEFQDILKSTAGLNRLLVYLLAPVAAEESNHVQLILSDPRQARALVNIFRDRNEKMELDGEVTLMWAFQEAKSLLSSNSKVLEKLRKRMESGGATVGDCVCVVENLSR